MKKHSGRTRDLLSSQPGINGKGDKNRTENDEAYRKNYDEINWGPGCCGGGCHPENAPLEFSRVPPVPPLNHSSAAECGCRPRSSRGTIETFSCSYDGCRGYEWTQEKI
jgi:hypothetical protein